MAHQSKLTIRVSAARGSSTVNVSTSGRYINLLTNGINLHNPRQPVQPTSTAKAFWTSVLTLVQAEIAALP